MQSPTKLPPSWMRQKQELIRSIRSHLAAKPGAPMDLSRWRHHVITLAIHELCYDLSLASRTLRFIYNDTSISQPMAFGRLKPLTEVEVPKDPAPLRIGLLSQRHPEMDYFLDLYVSSNYQLSKDYDEKAHTEVEEHSWSNAWELFKDLKEEGSDVIEVYHTGLEPMVFGFYRAVCDILAIRHARGLRRDLFFIPKLFCSDRKEVAERISPETAGASINDYISLPAWY